MTVRDVLILLESFLGKQSKEQNTGIIGAILSKIYLVSYNSHDYKVIQNGKGQGTAPLKYLPYVRIQLDFQQNMDHKFVQLLQIIQGGKFSQLWNSTVDSLDTFVVPWVHSNQSYADMYQLFHWKVSWLPINLQRSQSFLPQKIFNIQFNSWLEKRTARKKTR